MQTSIAQLQKLIVSGISESMPDLAVCRTFAGRFNIKELEALSTRVPAVFVSFLRTANIDDRGDDTYSADLQFAAFILTKDSRDISRQESGLNIAQSLAVLLKANQWKASGVSVPRDINIQNLFDSAARGHAIALHAVEWRQQISLMETGLIEDGVLPTRLYTSAVPNIGLEHEDDYDLAWEAGSDE